MTNRIIQAIDGDHGVGLRTFALNMSDGSMLEVPYMDPVAYLDRLLQASMYFRAVIQAKLGEFPPGQAPWHIVLYTDEITPGNPMRSMNRRKAWITYWSFLELIGFLGDELFWFAMCVIRSDQVHSPKKKKDGVHAIDGMSQVYRKILTILSSEDSLCSGKWLRAVRHIIYAKPTLLIGDEPAIKHCVGHKGSAGNKPCLQCRNCVSHRSDLWKYSGELVSLSESDFSQFRGHTTESLRACVDLLSSRHPVLNRKEFSELEQSLGLNHCPMGVLWDAALRDVFLPVHHVQYDWMHCCFVQGVFQLEITLQLVALAGHGFTYSTIHDFLTLS